MKEDILEQIVDDYLKFNGFFTIHNVKFQPSSSDPDYSPRKDCVPSDVDVIGFHPMRVGTEQVLVVSCKSWQSGFAPKAKIAEIEQGKKIAGRDSRLSFRELAIEKWGKALMSEVQKRTGSAQFTYVTAVTRLIGDSKQWENHPSFRKNLGGNPIKILTLQEMLGDLYARLKTTVASSEVGRLLQVIKASGWNP